MLRYMPGFGNDFETEALPGSLPQGQNSPQRCNYGLYAEQFRALRSPRRAAPTSVPGSIACAPRCPMSAASRIDLPFGKRRRISSITAFRSDRCAGARRRFPEGDDVPDRPHTITTAGDVYTQVGMASHLYFVNAPMVDEYFFNADGELMIAPQAGRAVDFHRTRPDRAPGPAKSR